MKILTADEIRRWDQYTIEHEPVLSIDLMERAAQQCAKWILTPLTEPATFSIFCAKGNNGGDGLAIARLLMEKKYPVSVFILEFGHLGTEDFQTNLARLNLLDGHDIHFIQSEEHFPTLAPGAIIIDALFGSGLNRPLEGITARLVQNINASGCPVISIDIPSGLSVDRSSKDNISIHATHTLSFQCYKPAFFFAENEDALGQLHILDIGLHPAFYEKLDNQYELVDEQIIRALHKKRKTFAHKGNFGHALLVAGSYGKMGAAVLAAKACLRSGAGLLTCHIPQKGYEIMQTAVPEAMVSVDNHDLFNTRIENDLHLYDAIGLGPGAGTSNETLLLLENVLQSFSNPLVIDADALNGLGLEKELMKLIPPGSILTPHPKEFERLFGKAENDFDRITQASQKATELNSIIILKGHFTCIATPVKTYFNSTGNPGMATGGTGDVLTGIITGLLAQGYGSIEAALLGVWLHGRAGDLAALETGMEALIAGDVIEKIGAAFLEIYQPFAPTGQ